MKIAEIILAACGLTGMLLSLFLIPGGNIITVFSLSLLSLLYFFWGFALFNSIRFRHIFKKSSYESIKAMRIVGAVATGILLSIAVYGIMFKAMRWPGSSVMLITSIIPLLLVIITAGIKFGLSKDNFYKGIVARCGIIFTLVLIMFYAGTQIFRDFKYRNYPELYDFNEEGEVNQDAPDENI